MPAQMLTVPGVGGAAAPSEVEVLLRSRRVRTVYQRLVDLASGATVGFEALTRGPAGPLEAPSALFHAAYGEGRVAELDWVARASALRTALDAGLDRDLSWFVNTEPASMRTACPPDLRPIVSAAREGLRVVMEVTERAVTADPAALLAGVERARAAGWSIALDDVGADPASLAMMPFLRPDVIKLDLRLIQNRPSLEIARTVNAVLAQSERTGATILAEGIETAEHADIARAMGATVGQGWLFDRPGPLPAAAGLVTPLATGGAPTPRGAPATPFAAVAAHRPVNRTRKDLLLPMSFHLEHAGLDPNEPIVLLGCFQHTGHFTPMTRHRYADLARTAAFVGALGAGMPVAPAPGVRGADLADDDPLRGEWNVIAIGSRFAGALVARDCGDTGPDAARRFDYAITHDRDLVIEAANTLLTRLLPR
ncbi:sensor domain-containing phosphodiesterase [Virgisporangium ochraceum]|nr:EAL domain-containing protein [Virgisporangium ochraceum]